MRMRTKIYVVLLLALLLWVSHAKQLRMPKVRSARNQSVHLKRIQLRLLRRLYRYKKLQKPLKTINDFKAAANEIQKQEEEIIQKRNLIYKMLKTMGYKKIRIVKGKSKRWKTVWKRGKGKKRELLGFKLTVPLRRYKFAGYPVVVASIKSKEFDKYITKGIIPIRYATHRKFEVFIPVNTENRWYSKKYMRRTFTLNWVAVDGLNTKSVKHGTVRAFYPTSKAGEISVSIKAPQGYTIMASLIGKTNQTVFGSIKKTKDGYEYLISQEGTSTFNLLKVAYDNKWRVSYILVKEGNTAKKPSIIAGTVKSTEFKIKDDLLPPPVGANVLSADLQETRSASVIRRVSRSKVAKKSMRQVKKITKQTKKQNAKVKKEQLKASKMKQAAKKVAMLLNKKKKEIDAKMKKLQELQSKLKKASKKEKKALKANIESLKAEIKVAQANLKKLQAAESRKRLIAEYELGKIEIRQALLKKQAETMKRISAVKKKYQQDKIALKKKIEQAYRSYNLAVKSTDQKIKQEAVNKLKKLQKEAKKMEKKTNAEIKKLVKEQKKFVKKQKKKLKKLKKKAKKMKKNLKKQEKKLKKKEKKFKKKAKKKSKKFKKYKKKKKKKFKKVMKKLIKKVKCKVKLVKGMKKKICKVSPEYIKKLKKHGANMKCKLVKGKKLCSLGKVKCTIKNIGGKKTKICSISKSKKKSRLFKLKGIKAPCVHINGKKRCITRKLKCKTRKMKGKNRMYCKFPKKLRRKRSRKTRLECKRASKKRLLCRKRIRRAKHQKMKCVTIVKNGKKRVFCRVKTGRKREKFLELKRKKTKHYRGIQAIVRVNTKQYNFKRTPIYMVALYGENGKQVRGVPHIFNVSRFGFSVKLNNLPSKDVSGLELKWIAVVKH